MQTTYYYDAAILTGEVTKESYFKLLKLFQIKRSTCFVFMDVIFNCLSIKLNLLME
jgi:hypothetical protein